jgi:murein DD-endopeptidase MepM/ murein hydrolase activator NlpD
LAVTQEDDSQSESVPAGLSRRALMVFGTLAAVFGGEVATQILAANPAFASGIAWNHPFVTRRQISDAGGYFGVDFYYSGGVRKDRASPHTGIDLDGPRFMNVYSCATGVVTWAGTGNGFGSWGHWVQIEHAPGVRTGYAHLTPGSIAVAQGQTLTSTTKIGEVGSSGGDYAAHLHLAEWSNGQLVDPEHLAHASLAVPGQISSQQNGPKSMTTRFGKIGTGTGGVGTVVALAGDAGFPCAANWQEYTRTVADQGTNDRAYQEFNVHGGVIWIAANKWDELKTAYTVASPTVLSTQTVSLSAEDRALLAEISSKLSTP